MAQALMGTYHADALLKTLNDLHYLHEKEVLYTFVLNRASEVLKAYGGTFFSIREDIGEMIPEASKGVSLTLLKEIPFKMKSGISGWTASNRRPLLIENAQMDDRFNRAVDVITGVRTRSVIAVPVIRQDVLLGVIELVNRVDGVFRDADLQFMMHLSQQVGIAIENCNLLSQLNTEVTYTDCVINSLTGGFISTDANGIVTRINNKAARILHANPTEVLNKPVLTVLPSFGQLNQILESTLKNQSPQQRQEITFSRDNQSPLVLGYSTFLIKSDTHEILGAGLIFQDLSNLNKAA